MVTTRDWKLPLAILCCCPVLACSLTGTGRHSLSPCRGVFPIEEGGLWGYIDSSGRVVCPPQFAAAETLDEDRAPVAVRDADHEATGDDSHALWGYVNACGRLVIKPQFSTASAFREGLARVRLVTGETAYIDPQGNIQIKLNCDAAESFAEGLAAVQAGGKWGYIDRTGRWTIPPRFDYAAPFSKGRAAVEQHEQQGYISRTGSFLVTPAFDEVAETYSEGLAVVRCNDRIGYIDEAGALVIDLQFDPLPMDRLMDSAFHHGLAAVRSSGSYCYIDKSGKIAISDPRFGFIRPFLSPYAAVAVDTHDNGWKYGYINTSGQFVIEPRFDAAADFVEGWASVSLNGRHTFLNQQGMFLVEPQFDKTWDVHDGLARVRVEEQNGYLDLSGRIVWGLDRYRGWHEITEVLLRREGPPSFTASVSAGGDILVTNKEDSYGLRGTVAYDPKDPGRTTYRGRTETGFDQLAKAIVALGFGAWESSYKPRRSAGGRIDRFTLTVTSRSGSKSVESYDVPDCGPPELHALVGYVEAIIARSQARESLWSLE